MSSFSLYKIKYFVFKQAALYYYGLYEDGIDKMNKNPPKIKVSNTLHQWKYFGLENFVYFKLPHKIITKKKYQNIRNIMTNSRNGNRMYDGVTSDWKKYLQRIVVISVKMTRLYLYDNDLLFNDIPKNKKEYEWCVVDGVKSSDKNLKSARQIEKFFEEGFMPFNILSPLGDDLYIFDTLYYLKLSDFKKDKVSLLYKLRVKVGVDHLTIFDMTYDGKKYKRSELTEFLCDVILTGFVTYINVFMHAGIYHFHMLPNLVTSTETLLVKTDPLRILVHPLIYDSIKTSTTAVLTLLEKRGFDAFFNLKHKGVLNLLNDIKLTDIEDHLENDIWDRTCSIQISKEIILWKKTLHKFIDEYCDEHLNNAKLEEYDRWINSFAYLQNHGFQSKTRIDKIKTIVFHQYIITVYHQFYSSSAVSTYVNNPLRGISPVLTHSKNGTYHYSSFREQLVHNEVKSRVSLENQSFDILYKLYDVPHKYNKHFKKLSKRLKKYESDKLFTTEHLLPSNTEFGMRW